ncbi:MAG: hypothetical protein R6X13_03015 [bacterium]
MKNLTAISTLPFVLSALVGLACLQCEQSNPEAYLSITITSQPVGGSGVNTVTCSYQGTSTRGDGQPGLLDEVVDVTTVWHSSHGTYNEEIHAWTAHNQVQTFSTSKSAPPGMYLDKPFWLVLTWRDKDGEHKLVSDTAFCQ